MPQEFAVGVTTKEIAEVLSEKSYKKAAGKVNGQLIDASRPDRRRCND